MSLITGNKVKKIHKPRYCEKEKAISLLNISVYRLQPRLFIDSLPYLKKTKRTIKSYGSTARLDQAIVIKA
jgi:hypothetical protein